MNFKRDVISGKIPVTIITGFLGSGKTTLIRQLLVHPSMNKVAVVINEIGEIGIDQDLVTLSSENISLLANGCICCSVRTDMQETLRDLFTRRTIGDIFDFDRIIIETTGLADPAPILQTLVSDTLLEAQFRFDGLVTLVDAVNLPDQLENLKEPEKQLAIADRIFVTKTDLIGPIQMDQLVQLIRDINPSSPIQNILHGNIDPNELMGIGLTSSKASQKTLNFLGENTSQTSEKYMGDFARRHTSNIQTETLRFKTPFTWQAFSSALDLLTTLRGVDLLRVKGIINVENQPIVVQGVQHIFHPPVTLDQWPSEDHDSRIVFITRNIPKEVLKSLFDVVTQVVKPAELN